MVAPYLQALLLAGLVTLGITAMGPAQAAPDGTSVFSGLWHNCVVKANGNVYCWGTNSDHQADGYTGGDAVAGAAGAYHTCVLKSNGNVHCWGATGVGHDNGQTQDYAGGDAVAVAAGAYHTCVLETNGNVDCYGNNVWGQSNDYTGGDAISLGVGVFSSCVVKSNHNPHCWGFDTDMDWYTDEDLAWIATKDSGSICLGKTNGDAHCFFGWISSSTVKAAVGYTHACVLTTAGNVDCEIMGGSDYGQAADYSNGDAVDISAGEYHTCVLKTDGSVDCYGISAGYGDYRVPPAPTGVSAAAGSGAGQIVLNWNAVTGVYPTPISYKVYRSATSGGETLVTIGACANPGVATTCTDSGLGDGATRFYKVSAVNDLGEGPLSSEVSATTNIYPPSPPGNFRYDLVLDRLLWDPPTYTGGSAVDHYKVSVRVSQQAPIPCPPNLQPGPLGICNGGSAKTGVITGGCANLGNVLSCQPSDCPALFRCFYRVSAVAGEEGPEAPEVLVVGAR